MSVQNPINLKKREPLVSVIIAVKNGIPYLKDCLESVRKQSYSNIETFVVDDGSTDETWEYLQTIESPQIRMHRQANMGVSASRNRALDSVGGKYLLFLDADDWISEHHISECVATMESECLDLLSGPVAYTTTRHAPHPVLGIGLKDLTVYSGAEIEAFRERLVGFFTPNSPKLNNSSFLFDGVGGQVYSRETVGALRFNEDLRSGEDTLFNLEYALKAHRVGVTKTQGYFYWQNPMSVTQSPNFQAIEMGKKFMAAVEALTRDLPELRNYVDYRAWNTFYESSRRVLWAKSGGKAPTLPEALELASLIQKNDFWPLNRRPVIWLSKRLGKRLRLFFWCYYLRLRLPLALLLMYGSRRNR